MAFSKDTLNTAAGKAAELGKKGFSLYAEMVDKVMDSVVDLANSKDDKVSGIAAKVLDSSVVRKSAPYVVIVSTVFDLNFLTVKKAFENHKNKRITKKAEKAQ